MDSVTLLHAGAFTLFTRDAGGNTLETQYGITGLPARALLSLADNFSGGHLDAGHLLNRARQGFGDAGISQLEVKTADGVAFHFTQQTGADNRVQQVLVVDDTDVTEFKKAHGNVPVPPGMYTALAGVDVLQMDITGLVQAFSAPGATPLVVDTVAPQTLYTYRTAGTVNAATLDTLNWTFSGDKWSLGLPDGNRIYLSAADSLTAMTLRIDDVQGGQWQLVYGVNDEGLQPRLMQAVDLSGHSHAMVVNGSLTASWAGEHAGKTGVVVDLTQDVQQGAGAQGERLGKVTRVSGSDGDDVLTGNAGG